MVSCREAVLGHWNTVEEEDIISVLIQLAHCVAVSKNKSIDTCFVTVVFSSEEGRSKMM